MPLPAGTRVAQYEVVTLAGAGGMGEVYRARDMQLKREVALKVLPAIVARDPDRLARFQREAEILASLNHPGIAVIYGMAESSDIRAIAMEFVEGPTLAESLEKGALPAATAQSYARQIVEALEYAHERGVMHRDLKPANIKITPEGSLKLLDFGLAKAIEDPVAYSDPSHSPTLTLGHTQAGQIMGTAAYMSPEQAVGKQADRRADVFSFGVVLYEMLTGRRPFTGSSAGEILASVVKDEPDWTKVPTGTPEALRTVLRRCLAKERKQRMQAIGEARILLESSAARATAPVLIPAKPPLLWIAATAVMAVLAAVALWGWLKPVPAAPRLVTHFITSMPKGISSTPPAVSKDGSRVAFAGGATGGPIYLRTMDDPVAKPIPGTEGGTFPIFSPDGQWLAFYAGVAPPFQLKKVPISGGAALTLASGMTGTSPLGWGEDGNILLAAGDLRRILAAGGEPVVIAKPDPAKGEVAFLIGQPLPGGKHILTTVVTTKGLADLTLAATDVKTGERTTLLEGVGAGWYAPTGVQPGMGHLVYGRNGSLFAATFNATTLQPGPPAPVLEGVLGVAGLADFGLSPSGTLAYASGGSMITRDLSTLMWVDRQGVEKPVGAPSRVYSTPRISPDGGRVAVQVFDLSQTIDFQIWLYDLARGTPSRLTFERVNGDPVWTHDGKRLIYWSGTIGNPNATLASVAADGSGPPVQLMGEGVAPVPTAVSADGKLVIGVRSDTINTQAAGKPTGNEVWILPLDGEEKQAKPQPFLDTRFTRGYFQFSPDGKWVAYESNESGRNEVFVVPYPGPGGKSQVSTDGGTQPRWNRNGRELFFRNGDKMMAVEVETGPPFRPGTPKVLFTKASADYDVDRDGKRFLMMKAAAAPEGAASEMHVVLNWFDELRRRVPLNPGQ